MLNLRSGYQHIALDDDAIKKTAFVMPFGKYKYLEVPFGLAQALTYFQNLMNKVLNGLHFMLAYLDDVMIFSESAEQHLKHIQIVSTRLKQAKLRHKRASACSSNKSFTYLGHFLMTNRIKLQLEKIKVISKMKLPKNQKGVREFWGWLAITGN